MHFVTPLCLLSLVNPIRALGWNNVSTSRFETIVEENDIALVAFVAPSTEASKFLESEWSLATAQTKVPLLTIDCAIETQLCSEQGVVSLPAIRLFKGRKSQERYRGRRTASEILSYIQRSRLPDVSLLDSTNITSFKSVDEYVFIAYLGLNDSESKTTFESLAARNHHRFTFGLSTDVRPTNAENVPVPSIICYKASENERTVFSGEWRLKSLETFVETSTVPLIGELTRRNEIKYLQAGKSLIYAFAITSSERLHYQSLLKSLAKKYKEYINFVTVDAVEYAHMAPGLGLEEGRFPALVLQNPMFGQVFPFDAGSGISEEAVEGWVLDIVAGKVAPWAGESDEGIAQAQGTESRTRDEL